MSRLIQTYTGKLIDPLEPSADVVDIVDIAWSLAHTCRFRGHCLRYYSVAEHCLRGYVYLLERDHLRFLLHDASEAYMMDAQGPIKVWMWFEQEEVTAMGRDGMWRYKQIEREWTSVINNVFGIEPDDQGVAAVKYVDERLLATERRDLMRPTATQWERMKGIDPYPDRIAAQPTHTTTPEPMAHAFLQTYGRLTGDHSWKDRI